MSPVAQRAAITLAVLLSCGSVAIATLANQTLDSATALREQRLGTLKDIQALLASAFRAGEVPAAEVHRALLELSQAKLELTQTKEERIAIYEETVKEAEQWESNVQALARAAEITQIDVLRAKASLLQAKIDLAIAREDK